MTFASNGSGPSPDRPERDALDQASPADGCADDGIVWGVPPDLPGEEPDAVAIFRAPAHGGYLRGVWISENVQAVLTHWDGSRSRPCRGGVDACEGCKAVWNTRLLSYGAGLIRGDTWGIVELTEQATRSNLSWTHPRARLRGRGFALHRVQAGPYSRVVASTSAEVARLPDGITLPPAPDLRSLLTRIWAG